MCYTLKSIFVNTLRGPVEIEGGFDEYLLPCEVNPPAQFHIQHPSHFLTPQSHRFILSRIAYGSASMELESTHELAKKLLTEHPYPRIQALNDCAFIFYPRWIQGKTLCRQLGKDDDEIVLRVDATSQTLGLIALDMVSLANVHQSPYGEAHKHNAELECDVKMEYKQEDQNTQIYDPYSAEHHQSTGQTALSPLFDERLIMKDESFDPCLADFDQFTGLMPLDPSLEGKPTMGNTFETCSNTTSWDKPELRIARSNARHSIMNTQQNIMKHAAIPRARRNNAFWAPKTQHSRGIHKPEAGRFHHRPRRASRQIVSYAEYSGDEE